MPDELARFLFGHEVGHVIDLGWRHIGNGKLMASAEAEGFEVFITKDSNIPYQQSMDGRQIALVILRPKSQNLNTLLALAPEILRILPTLKAGTVTKVTG